MGEQWCEQDQSLVVTCKRDKGQSHKTQGQEGQEKQDDPRDGKEQSL